MTELGKRLIQRIRSTGPMTVAEYMRECLLHPEFGYYSRHDPLGVSGDFTTAPEISQMFGELLGLALAQAWLDREAPRPVCLAELGPGRGTLMADILRASRTVPEFPEAVSVHLVEASPVLRDVQRKTIDRPLRHHDSIESLPRGPLFLVANEFFDALPVRQLQRDGAAWRERMVGVDNDGNLTLGLSDPVSSELLADRLGDTRDGDIVEIRPAARAIAADIGARIAESGGLALVVDYGGQHSLGDTLQAVHAHGSVPPLTDPGMADLTAHVDFGAIARAARPAAHTRVIPQGEFLERLGIVQRAERLAEGLTGSALESHRAALRRLTHEDEMGTLFRAMALYEDGTPLPPGFTA
ncbi:MAG: class I SAM-dependent methyltransferase [Boseongicola sp. SB0677_bin_26]|nr:class I SAM-dependent methyltransferase [Boseongicola sp. SB0665_bin_10]MYG28667.1 class I SAM-dependent methyltransferase [Boseongicola sp. SB0677_bin_26]